MKGRSILFVGHHDPTGRTSGAELRMLGIARGLAQVGTVDYLQRGGRSWRPGSPAIIRPSTDASSPFHRWTRVAAHGVPHRMKPGLRYPWAVWASLAPRRARPLLAARYPRIPARTVREAIPTIADYDLIWFFKLETILAFWTLFSTAPIPCVADLDDLASADRDDLVTAAAPFSLAGHQVRARVEQRIDLLDRRAWASWQARVLERADTVVLANPQEVGALDAPRVRVVPNGYTVPPRNAPRALHAPPVFTFVCTMKYFPNRDAVAFFVDEVLPHLRRELGDELRVRFVGDAPGSVTGLTPDPNVTFTGYVDDLSTELGLPDVAIVPLRHGSGTRLKILEAFANQIPVVSTTVGAAGLEARDGEHLLIADSGPAFAQACVRIVRNPELRDRLVGDAYELVAREHDWPNISEKIGAIVEETIDPTAVE